jgi:hypothetical protein
VIALASTNESFLNEYASEAELKPGDPVDLDFKALLERYLERTRWISVRKPFMEAGEKAEKHRLTDEELGPRARRVQARQELLGTDFSSLPVSPDRRDPRRAAQRRRARSARSPAATMVVDYGRAGSRRCSRRARARSARRRAGTRRSRDFNNGTLDAVILNQSGATGLSLHASEKFEGPEQAAHDHRPGRGQHRHPHADAGPHPPHRPGGDAALHPAHPGHSGREAPGCRAGEEDGVAERQHDGEPQERAERRERHRLHERVRRSRRRPRHARRARA